MQMKCILEVPMAECSPTELYTYRNQKLIFLRACMMVMEKMNNGARVASARFLFRTCHCIRTIKETLHFPQAHGSASVSFGNQTNTSTSQGLCVDAYRGTSHKTYVFLPDDFSSQPMTLYNFSLWNSPWSTTTSTETDRPIINFHTVPHC